MRRSPPVPRNRHIVYCCLGAALVLVTSDFLSSPVSAETPPIVFVSRTFDAITKPELRVQPVERARHGRLLVRESSGRIRTLVDAFTEGDFVVKSVANM